MSTKPLGYADHTAAIGYGHGIGAGGIIVPIIVIGVGVIAIGGVGNSIKLGPLIRARQFLLNL